MFSREFCEISKNTFFIEHLWWLLLFFAVIKQKLICALVYERHFHKQNQAEISKKVKQKLNNTLRLNFRYLKIIYLLHPFYQPKLIWDVQKTSVSVLKAHSQAWGNFWQMKALQKWWKMLFISP